MATYSNSASLDYDFDMFEQHTRVSAAAAPAKKERRSVQTKKPELKLVENKNAAPVPKEDKRVILRSAFIVIFAVMVLAVIGLQINAGARSYELSRQIESVEKKIAEAKTENVRLNNELNSITTIENIDAYARDILGMSKSESYQIRCIDLSDENRVLYSGSGLGILNIFDKNN